MSGALLDIRELTVRYAPNASREVLGLAGVSLTVGAGEVLGILGESGSGKSTLAAALLRLLPSNAQSTGTAMLDGRDLLALPARQFRELCGCRISLISQDPAVSLNPVMKVGTQISEVLRAHLPMNRSERSARVRELLGELGFPDADRIASRYPHQLSGGQRQRVAIAQAIACRPALVIADECTSKLDAILERQVIDSMSEIVGRNRTTLLWITHDPATLAGFADRTAVVDHGRVIELGATEEVFRRPQHPYTQELIELARKLGPASWGSADSLRYAH
jgi:ABC-type glutathione transport system ATPase component